MRRFFGSRQFRGRDTLGFVLFAVLRPGEGV